MSNIEVSRFPFLNGGSLWAVTFAAGSGDVDSLYFNGTGLSGTSLRAALYEDIAGSAIGGTFRLYSGASYVSEFPPDASDPYLEGLGSNGSITGRSDRLEWNASAEDVQAAVNGLFDSSSSQGVGRAVSCRLAFNILDQM